MLIPCSDSTTFAFATQVTASDVLQLSTARGLASLHACIGAGCISFCGSKGADQKVKVNTNAENANNVHSLAHGSNVSTSVGDDGFKSSSAPVMLLGLLATFFGGCSVGSNKSRLEQPQQQGKTH
jgi:hypothetical protein